MSSALSSAVAGPGGAGPLESALARLTDPAGSDADRREAADGIRDLVQDMTLAQHEITGALIAVQDRMTALRALTQINVESLGEAEADVRMLTEARTMTDSDTVVLVGDDTHLYAGPDPEAAAALVRLVRDQLAAPRQVPIAVTDGGATVVAVLRQPDPFRRALGFARDGWAFTTGDLQLVEAVMSATDMMQTLTRMHLEAVERAAIAQEHQAASSLAQAVLAQPLPRVDGVELFCSSMPASLAGGDFHVFAVVDGRLWFAVGDVAGKGLPAAIVMSRAVSATRVALRTSLDPGAAVAAVSAELYDYLGDVGVFVTLVVGVLDPADGTVRACNAGHSPVLVRQQGRVRPVAADTAPVGVLEIEDPTVTELRLAPGDALLVGSDGLAEQEDGAGELFGYVRLEQVLAGGPSSAEELGRQVLAAVAGHADGTAPSDDCTLVVLTPSGAVAR
ncbi:PP2C family protein-serine/threonine phosphatase [Nakamurella endophytica]|uniref:PPM-type phosphatase domain-containing protein n=1 Tax=Nakamurella endophytica TaxID=1748367 RepID=A0A917WJ57_9ACTN|nr:PP2C family protein-serine/threonine phosphatase [Nakamurella endophytica]GGM08977.1 hypothetical protein GCM10011594_31090 [Nakamurella endophytica]